MSDVCHQTILIWVVFSLVDLHNDTLPIFTPTTAVLPRCFFVSVCISEGSPEISPESPILGPIHR